MYFYSILWDPDSHHFLWAVGQDNGVGVMLEFARQIRHWSVAQAPSFSSPKLYSYPTC